MGREEERLLFPAESYTDAADTSGSGGVQKKARRRKPKTKPAVEGEGGDEQAKKRRLSDEQARHLEMSFRKERKLETPRKVQLAAELGLDAKQVAVWFQNRRARHKSKLMEEEFAKLREAHDAAVLQNCQLETELVKLKDRLADAEEEKRKLTTTAAAAAGAVAGGGSPSSSSLSTVTCNLAALMGQFGVDEDAADLSSYMNDYAYNSYMMDFAAGYFGGIFNAQ